MDTHHTPAVVVGAGPVGLTVACLLSAYGLDVLIVERNPTTSDEPKAISLDDESMRTLKLAGVGRPLDRVIAPGTGTQYHDIRGRKLFRAGSHQPLRFGHPFKNPFAQPELEAVLREELDSRENVALRFQTELVGLVHTAEGVRAELYDARTGTSGCVAASFLVACDGGRSTVRELLAIGMRGRSFDEQWLVADVDGDDHRERFGLHFGTPHRPTVIIPGVNGRCRYEFRLLPGEGEPGRPPDFALIERLIASHRPIAPDQLQRAVVYRFNALVADRWRDRFTFLAGDAAHMMPPFAGQGLNSGVRDAANLCWKVHGVLAGVLDRSVLDSYEQERRPNAEATVRLSQRLGSIVFTTNQLHAMVRDLTVRAVLALRPGRRWLQEMRYRPTVRVTDGLVIAGSDRVGSLLEQPVVFDLGAHRAVPLDQVLGRNWSVIGVDTDDAAWTAMLTTPLTRLQPELVSVGLDDVSPPLIAGRSSIGDFDGRLQAVFGPSRGFFLLVRPDRVIAAEFAPSETAAVAAAVAKWQPIARRASPTHRPRATRPLDRSHRRPKMSIPQPDTTNPRSAPAALSRTSTSHLAIRVADVDIAAAFYRRVLGLTVHDTLAAGGLRLGWGRGHHVIDLLEGTPGLDHFAFAVDDPAELARVQTQAVQRGLAVAPLPPNTCAADLDGFEISDPAGNRVQFHGAVDRSGELGDAAANRPVRLQHITLASSAVGEMLKFFRDVLGFRQSDVLGKDEFVWLRSNREHHTLAMVNSDHNGLDHFAFDVTGWQELKAWCDRLTDENVRITWGPGRHGPGNNLFVFFDDPDGNRIELSAELERFHDDRVVYAPRRWDAVAASVNLWGGLLPSFRRTGQQG